MPRKQDQNQLVQKFWDNFLTDKFIEANLVTEQLKSLAVSEKEKNFALCLQAKILLRQGQFKLAYQIMQDHQSTNGFKLFLEFLINGNPLPLLQSKAEDTELLIYQAQGLALCRLYWGEEYLEVNQINLNPDKLIEIVFDRYLAEKEIDKAILASIQTIEISLEENSLSNDIQLPIIQEHINNLLELARQASFDSTRARLYLLKARIFEDKDAAEMAEILFGKEQNHNGLGETYMLYAKDFDEPEYYQKAIKEFAKCNNQIAQGFIYESLASLALSNGDISEASELFDKSANCLSNGGVFEEYGLGLQKISLLAIKGKYQKVKEALHGMINPQMPAFFLAQAYQILGNTIVQIGDDLSNAKHYMSMACDIFKKLKRHNQLLYAQNIYFQLLLFSDDLEKITKLGHEIIQLATRLGNEEVKASKYLDLAFVTVRLNIEKESLDDNAMNEASEYFKKAIRLFQSQGNLIAEADTYQAIGSMFTGIGRLEEALTALLKAKKLYSQEKALLQSAITDTLIGILMLNYVVLNEQTYPIAQRHLEQALVYFSKENLSDLLWKTTFYLADLNQRYYINNKEKENCDLYQNRAKSYFLEMLLAIEAYQEEVPSSMYQGNSLTGITIDEAFSQAHRFFIGINDIESASKFRRNNERN